jgi:hypothetical protein
VGQGHSLLPHPGWLVEATWLQLGSTVDPFRGLRWSPCSAPQASPELSAHPGGRKRRGVKPPSQGYKLTHLPSPCGLSSKCRHGSHGEGGCESQVPRMRPGKGLWCEGQGNWKGLLKHPSLPRLWQSEPPDRSGPPLLHLLCSGGDPSQPGGAEPTRRLHAAGSPPLCPQAGGRPAGEGLLAREWWEISRRAVVGMREGEGKHQVGMW